jgi:endoglucanase
MIKHLFNSCWLAVILFLVSAFPTFAQLKINDKEYFDTQGLNVLVFSNEYNGFFFDEKNAGIELIHHGMRSSTGGGVRLQNTPEQWDLVPSLVQRKVDRASNTIEATIQYKQFDFTSRLVVKAEGKGVNISVYLDKPLPQVLEGKAGFNLEFLPAAYFEKTFLMDAKPGIFPLYPSSNTRVKPKSEKIQQFANHSTFDEHGKEEFIEPQPLATGKSIILAPEDPYHKVTITSEAEISLFDGRDLAQNGWFVTRSILPANKKGKVLEWHLAANTVPNWVREPNIGFSQVGYHPKQKKVAIIELDQNDTPLQSASLFQITPQGNTVEKLSGKVKAWGKHFRYNYLEFDFSDISETGVYYIKYGDHVTNTFPISEQVYETAWHPTLDVFLPVQMDHMQVNEAYRTWHGRPFMDDALQAPLNQEHFDGYKMGASTDTKFKPYERIPGLDIGGWFDAGDYDIQTGTHCVTISDLVASWEEFGLKRDQTFIDQKSRYVDIHRPDGVEDILQQIEHGTLNVVAQVKNIGHPVRGIIVPNLHQYHHLGDAITETDNLPYNPNLKPYESDGVSSGTMDDRWAFTERSPYLDYSTAGAFAAASRAMKQYNPALSDECLSLAKKLWQENENMPKQQPAQGFFARFLKRSEMSAAMQLYATTKEAKYAKAFEDQIWKALDESLEINIDIALSAAPYMKEAFKKKLKGYVQKYASQIRQMEKENPYGVPMFRRPGWGGNHGVINFAIANYRAYKLFPDLVEKDDVFKGLHYILGRHPDSNLSFVSGVGTKSKKVAYGSNRADFSFIAGGVVPGLLLMRPDFPENKENWPFFWGENEYIVDIAVSYIYLVNAADDLLKDTK